MYEQDKYHDSAWNPTLYSVLELNGSDMVDLLEYYNFKWDGFYGGWYASDGSLYKVSDAAGELSASEVKALPQGAAGKPVTIALWVEGYSSATKAFDELTSDVVVEKRYDVDDGCFAIVHGSQPARYLVVASDSDDGEQFFLLVTEAAISSGYFADIAEIDAGSTLDEVWSNIAEGEL